MMFISAALFGYFGFAMGLTYYTASGQFVFLFAMLVWTMKISAVAYALGGFLTIIRPFPGNLLYSAAGLLSALAFVVIAIMDFLDKQHASAAPIFLLLIFAAWNGYGSITSLVSLRQIMLMNPRHPMEPGNSGPPPENSLR